MVDTPDAPGEYVEGERNQSDKIEEILGLERDMEDMISLETGSTESSDSPTRTVATNTTK